MKVTHPYVLGVLVLAIAVGAFSLRKRNSEAASRSERSDYDAFVEKLGGDEPAIRFELSDLIRTTSAHVDSSDRAQINGLHQDEILKIAHVRAFISQRDEASAYHFVSVEHRDRFHHVAAGLTGLEAPLPRFRAGVTAGAPGDHARRGARELGRLSLSEPVPAPRKTERIEGFEDATGENLAPAGHVMGRHA